jgi:hypothetical protein
MLQAVIRDLSLLKVEFLKLRKRTKANQKVAIDLRLPQVHREHLGHRMGTEGLADDLFDP